MPEVRLLFCRVCDIHFLFRSRLLHHMENSHTGEFTQDMELEIGKTTDGKIFVTMKDFTYEIDGSP